MTRVEAEDLTNVPTAPCHLLTITSIQVSLIQLVSFQQVFVDLETDGLLPVHITVL